jgi:hypothetical protein
MLACVEWISACVVVYLGLLEHYNVTSQTLSSVHWLTAINVGQHIFPQSSSKFWAAYNWAFTMRERLKTKGKHRQWYSNYNITVHDTTLL